MPFSRQATVALCAVTLAVACAPEPTAPPAAGEPSLEVGALAATHPTLTNIFNSAVPNAPFGVAISKTGLSYVTEIAGNLLVRTKLPSTEFRHPFTAGVTPAHVVFNPAGTRAYVTNQTSGTLSVINTSNHSEITEVTLSNGGFNLIVSKNGAKVYVTTADGRVHVVRTSTNTISKTLQLAPVTNGLALDPIRPTVYISSRDGGRVYAIDTRTDVVLGSLNTGGMPQRMAVSPDGSELYIANETLGLDIWNLVTRTRVTTVAMPAYGLGLSPDGAHLYVTDPLGGTIGIVDRVTRASVMTINTGGRPRNVAFNLDGRTAMVTNEGGWVTVIR
jgi:YVTN family beta-propeller protein